MLATKRQTSISFTSFSNAEKQPIEAKLQDAFFIWASAFTYHQICAVRSVNTRCYHPGFRFLYPPQIDSRISENENCTTFEKVSGFYRRLGICEVQKQLNIFTRIAIPKSSLTYCIFQERAMTQRHTKIVTCLGASMLPTITCTTQPRWEQNAIIKGAQTGHFSSSTLYQWNHQLPNPLLLQLVQSV